MFFYFYFFRVKALQCGLTVRPHRVEPSEGRSLKQCFTQQLVLVVDTTS